MSDDGAVSRWMTFNTIGLLGLGVQLAVLAILIRVAGLHYLAATALSLEVTLLHNFAWHQRRTWRDRPSLSTRETMRRLARFHLLNGTVSLAGNLAVVRLLTGHAGVDPIMANLVSVAACSLINFSASQTFVFRAAQRSLLMGALVAASSIAPVHAAGEPPPLQPSTLAAWRAYEKEVDDRYARTIGDEFFARDAFSGDASWQREAELGVGGSRSVAVMQLPAPRPGMKAADVPGGRIHHWVGAIFVPGTTVDAVISYLQTHAGEEAGKYEDVIASRLIAREGDRLRVFMKLRRTKVITVTYNTEHSVEFRRVSGHRAASRSAATRIAELADAGTAGEREKAPEADSGYLWRLNAYWRYQQTPTGVLIECESLSLSRDIPTLLRPFISGVVEGVARESLEKTLLSLRRVLVREVSASAPAERST